MSNNINSFSSFDKAGEVGTQQEKPGFSQEVLDTMISVVFEVAYYLLHKESYKTLSK